MESICLAPLTTDQCRVLARSLGDRPETTMAVHACTRGLAEAYVIGTPDSYRAAIVGGPTTYGEPHVFGTDDQAVCELLANVSGWGCVLLEPHLLAAAYSFTRQHIAPKARTYESVVLVLHTRAIISDHISIVQLAGPTDQSLFHLDPKLVPSGFASISESFTEGVVAAAIAKTAAGDACAVATACVEKLTSRYGEITVYTLEEERRKGYCTACASLVARDLQDRDITPVWMTGADNAASLRVARKLGFVEHSRPTYVIRA